MTGDASRAGMIKPEPTPEGALIRLAREAARIKTPAAARAARISTARWSQVEQGYETKPGRYLPVSAPAATVAHMANAVGVEPERLAEAGRPDAAKVLYEIIRRESMSLVPAVPPPPNPGMQRIADDPDLSDELKEAFKALAERMQRRGEEEAGDI